MTEILPHLRARFAASPKSAIRWIKEAQGSQLPRVIVDISAQWHGPERAGYTVWRVEREIGQRLLRDTSLLPLPIVFDGGVMYAMDRAQAFDLLTSARSSDGEDVGLEAPPCECVHDSPAAPEYLPVRTGPKMAVAGQLRRCARIAARSLHPIARRVVIDLAPERARSELRESLRHAENAIRAILRPDPGESPLPAEASSDPAPVPEPAETRSLSRSTVVHPGRDDIILTCGPHVNGVPLRQLAETKATEGFRLASVCYGVKHIRRADGCPPQFSRDTLGVGTIDQLDASDVIFCTSPGVRDQLVRFAAESGRDNPRTRLLVYGAEPMLPGEPDIPPGPTGVLRKASSQCFALAHVTADVEDAPRLLVDIWQQLLQDPESTIDLLIAGTDTNPIGDIEDLLDRSSALREHVHCVDAPSDSELGSLYRDCRMFVSPCIEDGGGLDVVEALACGKPVICSDRAQLPEAVSKRVTCLDPLDREGWITAIRQAARQDALTDDDVRLPAWDDTADYVREQLLDLAKDRRGG